ncbi:hypothetical protein CEP54_007581 [Fusarium duplospermum]|uniref:Uncharacterized protein n=1 Tax=Fusarium duplospermum TaxID=1325734 RepID=A0A428Q0G4_9HYPO|nr:hypothetical protein CEP54_007581 [Fusarium duplospermum]
MFASQDLTKILPAYTEECTDLPLDGTRIACKYILTDEYFKKQIENARINTRAWVMQERYMSPRGLHFGHSQLFWECREAEAAETNPFGLTLGEPGLKSQYEDVRGYLDKESPTGTYDPEPGHVEFYHLVSQYSKCAPNLSFHSDKLIAFSAILKHYCTVHNDEMVAGMRRRCLEYDLVWTRTYDSYPSRPGQVDTPYYETYIAPSWSWASVRARITSWTM